MGRLFVASVAENRLLAESDPSSAAKTPDLSVYLSITFNLGTHSLLDCRARQSTTSFADKMNKLHVCLLLLMAVLVLVDQSAGLAFNRFSMLGSRANPTKQDFVPMLFHDPRFPQRRPQVILVP